MVATNVGLTELLNSISHDHDHTGTLANPNLLNDITGDRVLGKESRAKDFARMSDEGIFTGRRTRSIDVIDQIDGLKELKATLHEAGGSGAFKRLAETQQRNLSKIAKNVYRDSAKAITEYETYAKATFDQEAKILKQLERKFRDAEKTLSTAARGPGVSADFLTDGTKTLIANNRAAVEAVRDHFKDIRENSRDIVDRLKGVVADVEKETGIAAAEHMGKAGAAEVAKVESEVAKTGEAAKGFGSRLMENATAGGWRSVETVGLGALAGGLAISAIGDLTGSSISASDVQNGEKPGNIPMAGAKLIGAGIATAIAARTHHR
jgi:hypothetical protein